MTLDLMKRVLRRISRGPAAVASSSAPVVNSAVAAPKHYYGLDGLDEKLEPYIDFDNGIFVEAGANDGETQSNTAYFARHRGWRGLLVEPIPELAARCRAARLESAVENCALVASDGQSVPMTYCGLMSVVDGGWSDPEAERAHVEIGRQIQSLTTYHLDVPGRSLSALLDQHKITHVDLLSLDVEGFERQALEGLDLRRHPPRFILVEARFREDIDALLLPFYEAIAQLSHHDVLYRTKDG
jgi:FkbM family methyltransferase